MLGSSTFRHGVHPPETKHLTETVRVRRMPFPDEIVLPLRQHAGRPARLIEAAEPVRYVDWAEAVAYVDWLTRETGSKYRLLTAEQAGFDQRWCADAARVRGMPYEIIAQREE